MTKVQNLGGLKRKGDQWYCSTIFISSPPTNAHILLTQFYLIILVCPTLNYTLIYDQL